MKALFAALAAACLLIALPASASAFGISGYALTPSSTQAGGHPTTTFQFNRTGTESEDLRDMRIDLPPGLLANPEAANPKCTSTQFNADGCPDASQVGTLSYKYRVSGSFDVTVPGAMYVLEPDATDVATIGFVLRPPRYCIFLLCAVPQKIFQKTSFKLRSFDNPNLSIENSNAERAITTSIPLVFITPSFTSDVTLNQVKIVAQARAGKTQAGPYFMVSPTSCAAAVSTATITSYQNVSASATSSYTPTGCAQVPFNPTFDFQPTDKSGGLQSNTLFQMNVPAGDATIQNAAPKALDIVFPAGSGPSISTLAEWQGKPACSDADLQANTCPSASVVGLSAAQSSFLPPGLNGGAFITGPVGLTIPIGIRLVGPRGTGIIVRLTLGLRPNAANPAVFETFATFDNGPQLPYAQFALGLLPIYLNPQQCGPAVTNIRATGWNGAVVNRTATYDVTNCPAPDTTITAGPPATTTNPQPSFSFTSSIAGSTFKCQLDATPAVDCNSGSFQPAAPLAFGPHSFTVTAYNGPVADPTPATRSFTVGSEANATVTYAPSSLQAAAHPNLSTVATVGGGTVRSAVVTLPDGFQPSAAALPQCTNAAADGGTCAAASKVGTAAINATVGGSPVSGTGDVFLTQGPTAADAAGLAVKVQLGANPLILRAGAYTIKNGNAQEMAIRSIPATLGGQALTVTRLQLDLSGASRFLTNASKCSTASQFGTVLTFSDGTVAPTAPTAYQATGCASVPFAPTVTQTFPSTPQAGQPTGNTVDIDLPIDNGTLASFTFVEPPAFGPNFAAFGAPSDQCPASTAPNPTAVFDATPCPQSAKVGTMTINTPLLPAPLVGTVYLINKVPIPWFGVRFRQPGVTIDLIGATSLPQVDPLCNPDTDPAGFCQQQIQVRFGSLPDTPITHVKFDLTAPDRTASSGTISSKLLTTPSPGDVTCVPSSLARWTAVSHTGASRTGTVAVPIAGC